MYQEVKVDLSGFTALASFVRREIGIKHVFNLWCGLFFFDLEFHC
jgi:hypothetical protein